MILGLRRFWAIFIARNKEFYRDKGALGWTFIFPFLVIFGFGYLFRIGDQGLYKIGYLGEVENRPQIESAQWVKFQDQKLAEQKLRHHQVDLLLDLSQVPPWYWVSETSPKSRIAEKLYLQSVNPLVETTPVIRKTVRGKEIVYIEWLFPGLITVNVLWMALWGVGWVIVRQRKLGILKRYKASPLTSFEYLSAQMTSRLLILVLSGVIVFIGGHLIYPFETVGSYLDMLIIYVLGCLSLSSIGLLVAARISSEEFANGLINLLTFPIMFLSEIWFSLEGSPDWVKTFAKFLPLWHMTDGMRRIMTEGATLAQLHTSVLILIGTAVFFTLMGSWMFKWTKD